MFKKSFLSSDYVYSGVQLRRAKYTLLRCRLVAVAPYTLLRCRLAMAPFPVCLFTSSAAPDKMPS